MIEYTIDDDGFAIDVLSKGVLNITISNGCGSGIASRMGCFLLQKLLRVPIDKLKKVWKYHDAGYSVNPSHKSPDHKLIVDSLAHHNINVAMRDSSHTSRHLFGTLIHILLVWKGNAAYWHDVSGFDYKKDRFIS